MLIRVHYFLGGIALGALLASYGYLGWKPAIAETTIESFPQIWSSEANPLTINTDTKIVRKLEFRDDMTAKELAIILDVTGEFSRSQLDALSPERRSAVERNSKPVE